MCLGFENSSFVNVFSCLLFRRSERSEFTCWNVDKVKLVIGILVCFCWNGRLFILLLITLKMYWFWGRTLFINTSRGKLVKFILSELLYYWCLTQCRCFWFWFWWKIRCLIVLFESSFKLGWTQKWSWKSKFFSHHLDFSF